MPRGISHSGKSLSLLLKAMMESFVDFIYPPACLLCDVRIDHDRPLCEECWQGLMGLLTLTLHTDRKDFSHLTSEIAFDGVVSGWDYSPDLEMLVHRIKYQRGMKLAILLGRSMGKIFIEKFPSWENAMVLPVPLHSIRKRERGYNQSALLGRGLSELLSAEIHLDILIRRRNTSTQTRLDAQQRQENMKDAFTVRRPDKVTGKDVLLVDDVSTTGATLNSCAACLKDAGAREVFGVTLARPKLM